MMQRHLAGMRILAQGLVGPPQESAREAARSFGAHQGQDLPGVLGSLALRTAGGLDSVLAAFDAGEIVRGYPMRGTVFAVEASTLPWLTELCAAGPVRQAIARRESLGLTDAHVGRAGEVLEETTAGASEPGAGRGVLRADLMAAWAEAGVPVEGGCGYHLLAHFISTGRAAYGPWNAGETAVVDARRWLPAGRDLAGAFNGERIAAIAELALRYFTSHGPATVRDLGWWSKLPMRDISAALELVAGRLETGWANAAGRLHAEPVAAGGGESEQLYWRPGLVEEYAQREKETMRELLLPGFDELVLGYRDRLYLMDDHRHTQLVPGNNGVFKKAALRRGEVVGVWTRTGPAGKRKLALTPVAAISPAQEKRFEKLFARFPHAVA